MATTIKTIKALIKTKVENLQISGKDIFGEVFDYAQGDFTKYPVAVIMPIGGKGEVLDTHRNERTFQFLIKLYQEQSNAGRDKQTADDIMTQVSDAILIAFDQDEDLGGEVEIVRVVGFDLDFKVAAGTFNFATFRIDCVVIVPDY
jgi:hypothetical protein